MKIISKHKDYYDYLQGVYGIDPLLVYDRRKEHLVKFEPISDEPLKVKNRYYYHKYETHEFFVAGEVYQIYELDGKLYSPYIQKEVDKLNLALRNANLRESAYIQNEIFLTDKNKKFRRPVLYKTGWGQESIDYSLPFLDTFSFAKIMDAKTIYQKISAFLGWLKDNPEEPNTQTNKGKIITQGFDPRTSFRPKMKNQ